MPSINHKIFLLVLLLGLTVQAHASGGGEAKAEGGEGEAAAPVSKDQKEYSEKSAKLKTLATRIVDTEKEFQDLVHHKESTKDPEAIQAILKQMVDASERRNKAVEDYNKLRSDLQLRYPSEGQSETRHYQTQTKKSVEELEGVAGLDELLTRTKKIVEKKFAAFNEPDPKDKAKGVRRKRRPLVPGESGPEGPAGHDEDEKPARLRLEK